jgi:hypothetical protein
MPKSPLLVDRLLKTPHLETIVPRLQADVLHRLIQVCTLEDCAELIAMATPAQISQVLDLDLWRVRGRGADEQLDAGRFGTWLEVLMESGAEVAAEKVMGLDLSLVTSGLAQHVAVLVGAAISSYTMLDGTEVAERALGGELGCEIGGYVIQSKRSSAWQAIVDLLAFLDAEHPEYFHRLMSGCVRLSASEREPDGFHSLLQDREQDLFDLAAERDERREKQGYLAPAQARAFLEESRYLHLDRAQPPASPIVEAYFRAIGATASPEEDRTVVLPREQVVAQAEPAALAEVLDVLREAGVLTPPSRPLLEGGDPRTVRLAALHRYLASHAAGEEEIAYVANTLLAGCVIQGRAFTPQEAFDAATAIANLGLENWPDQWVPAGLIAVFQVGWTVLHRDVCLFTARRLINVIADLHCIDRDIQLRLNGLRRDLIQHLRDRAPWRARDALDVIVMLDAACWAALSGLIDECPVLHGAIGASAPHRHRIDASQFEFISENSQIAAAQEFLDSLPSLLVL